MKKLLLIHNSYRQQGGEDIAVLNELELLNEHYEVQTLFYENRVRSIFDIFSFLSLSNKSVNKDLTDTIKKFKPDLVYIHNTWFKISLGIFKILKKNNIKTLIKIHNFRYHCTRSGKSKEHLKDQVFCKACGFKIGNKTIINKYYPESFMKSFFAIYFGKKYIQIIKDEYFYLAVLTDFHKNFLENNYSRNKNVVVIPNYLKETHHYYAEENDYFVYAGRLSTEKGIYELIDYFLNSDLRDKNLKIIGSGPEFKKITNKYENTNIEFLGQISNDETLNLISSSKGVISATKLYEGQPTLLCEASFSGKVSLFPNSGGIKEFLPSDYDFVFEQYDYQDFTKKLNLLNKDDVRLKNSKKAKEFINGKLDPTSLIKRFNEILLKDD